MTRRALKERELGISRTLIAAAFSALVLLAARAQPMPLQAQDAWVRATPGSDIAAAYLTLHNLSKDSITVTGVRSSLASQALIHESTEQNGQSRMRARSQVTVEPGKSVKFQPGGLHIMLLGLTQRLEVGQSVPLVIVLGDGTALRVAAVVKPLSAE